MYITVLRFSCYNFHVVPACKPKAAFKRETVTLFFLVFSPVVGEKKQDVKNNSKMYSTYQLLSVCFQVHITMFMPPVCMHYAPYLRITLIYI